MVRRKRKLLQVMVRRKKRLPQVTESKKPLYMRSRH
jgi:hypothetical protein